MHSVNSPLKLELSTISNARWTVCGGLSHFLYVNQQHRQPESLNGLSLTFCVRNFIIYHNESDFYTIKWAINMKNIVSQFCSCLSRKQHVLLALSRITMNNESRNLNILVKVVIIMIKSVWDSYLSFNSKRIFFTEHWSNMGWSNAQIQDIINRNQKMHNFSIQEKKRWNL